MLMLFTIRLPWRPFRILGDLGGKAFERERRRVRREPLSLLPALMLSLLFAYVSVAQTAATKAAPGKIIIDTDIGDDIDDAFAVALALRSPELQILGITTTFGDTEMRAKLLDRLLGEVGRTDIPVAAGPPTPPKTAFTQLRYAQGGHFAKPSHPDAVTFLLEQIRQHPGEITLVCIGPLVNVGAAI